MVRLDGETRDPAGSGDPAGSPRVWVIALPFDSPPLTYNQLMGKHWSVIHPAMRTLNDAGFYLSRTRIPSCALHEYAGSVDIPGVRFADPGGSLLPRPFLSPVTVELIYWPGNNTVHDADNLAPTLKYLVDGLRKAGVFRDDRGRYIRTASCTVIERDDDPDDSPTARMMLVVRTV